MSEAELGTTGGFDRTAILPLASRRSGLPGMLVSPYGGVAASVVTRECRAVVPVRQMMMLIRPSGQQRAEFAAVTSPSVLHAV